MPNADPWRITVQAGGVALDLAAPGAEALARLRKLETTMLEAIARAGLRTQRVTWHDTLALALPGGMHASLPAMDATSVLTLPVFKAVAELALLLPACRLAADA